MPFVLFCLYVLLETLTFWGLAKWIGIGWTLLALFVTMFFGMTIATWEARRLMSKQVRRTSEGMYVVDDPNPGRTAGNVGLTMVGGLLLSMPGFVSTVLGALLIFSPTRSLFRSIIAASLFKRIEDVGVRVFEASPMAHDHDSYGSFGGFAAGGASPSAAEPIVIDEEELKEWSSSVEPEDFTDGGSAGTTRGGKK